MTEPSIAEKRQFVKDLYPGPKWAKRVKYMPDEQIYMIYHSKQALTEGERETQAAQAKEAQLQLDFEETTQ